MAAVFTRRNSIAAALATGILMLQGCASQSSSVKPSTTLPAVATASATTRPVKHSGPDMAVAEAFIKKIRPIIGPLEDLDKDHSNWSDPSKRTALATDVQPALRQTVDLLDDMAKQGHTAEVEMVGGDGFFSMAAVFGDAPLHQRITDLSKQKDEEGRWAKVALATAKYWVADKDAIKQNSALDELQNLAAVDPAAKMLVARADLDFYDSDPTPEIATRLDAYVTLTLKNPGITRIKEERIADAKRQMLVGKPMVLAGLLRDGTQFSTADLKGKVILVDFWASWCGPCKEELPRVKKEYADMHDKGLEVIGVSFDQTGSALSKFLTANPDMPWPQFYDPAHPFWKNEFGKEYSIHGIPMMFLIDKNGICRSVTAREEFEKMIPDLLQEKSAV